MLLGTLGANLFVNLLTRRGAIAKSQGQGVNSAGKGRGINRTGEGVIRACYEKNGFLMSPHLLTNFEIQKYYQNEPRYNGVYSRDKLPKIKNGAYAINLNEYSDIGTHWVALYVHNNDETYFDSFGVKHIPKEIKAFINRPLSSASQNKNITANIFRLQAYDSIMCVVLALYWLCIVFVLALFILCLQIFFHQMTLIKMI